jgi:hypothetical protein
LIREYPVDEPEFPGAAALPDVTATTRERRLYFVLAALVSINLLAICGIATFALLVKYF